MQLLSLLANCHEAPGSLTFMLRVLFRPEINLVLSVIMFMAGVVLTVGRGLGLIGQGEPALVFHMSAWALIVSGYGNILVSVVRQENANSQNESPIAEPDRLILPGDEYIGSTRN